MKKPTKNHTPSGSHEPNQNKEENIRGLAISGKGQFLGALAAAFILLLGGILFWLYFGYIKKKSADRDPHSNASSAYKYLVENTKWLANDQTKMAYSHPVKNLSHEETDQFILGKSFFRVPWVEAPSATTARDGLGPLFNANTCTSCHPHNGSGGLFVKKTMTRKKNIPVHRSVLLRLGMSRTNEKNGERNYNHNKYVDKTSGQLPDPVYGNQLNIMGNMKVRTEGKVFFHWVAEKIGQRKLLSPQFVIKNLGYGSLAPETQISPRRALPLVGLGLLDNISEEEILLYEDANDRNKDGISGKANYAYSPETGKTELGRFNWKASTTSVKQQIAVAFNGDMGLTNPLYPAENCTQTQKKCLEHSKASNGLDVPAHRLDAVTFYVNSLRVPASRNYKGRAQGGKLFKQIGCANCHRDSMRTKDGSLIHPYSDMLLHDMGPALADGVQEFDARGNEWRTPPLWGIGLRKKVWESASFLHDGRADTIEEAIYWHGGEALQARNFYEQLNSIEKKKLLRFIESL